MVQHLCNSLARRPCAIPASYVLLSDKSGRSSQASNLSNQFDEALH